MSAMKPDAHSTGLAEADANGQVPWRLIVSDVIRYWEPRRLVYNLVLLAIVLGQIAHAWPISSRSVGLEIGVSLLVLATIAKSSVLRRVPSDLFVQVSMYRDRWRRTRAALFVLGVALAATLTYFWWAVLISPASD